MAVDNQTIELLINKAYFPKAALYNRVIAKEAIYKAGHIGIPDQKLITNNVKQINWLFVIKTSNSNIPEYIGTEDFSVRELDYIHVELKEAEYREKISAIILKSIPKVSIVELVWNDTDGAEYHQWILADYGSKKRTENLVSAQKFHHSAEVLVDDINEFMEILRFDNVVISNLKALYKNWISKIEKYNFSKRVSGLIDNDTDFEQKNKEILELELKIRRLTTAAQKEKQLNKRMKLTAEIRKLKLQLKGIIDPHK